MNRDKIIPGSIIIGLFLNLLANAVWDYLPDKHVYTATGVMILVCILYLIKGFLTKLRQKYSDRRPRIPRKTVQFIPDTTCEVDQHWGNAEVRGEPAMSCHSKWYATNLTDEVVWILKAYLVRPRVDALISVRSPNSAVFGRYPILPRRTTEVLVDLFITPPLVEKGKSFKGKVVLIDQFNNKHKAKVFYGPPLQEEQFILCVRFSLKRQHELDNSHLSNTIRRKLKKTRLLLSQNLDISTSKTTKTWEIRDPEKTSVVYTAQFEEEKLNLYKCLISSIRHKVKVMLGLQNLKGELVFSIKANSKVRAELKSNRLPQEVRDLLEEKGELLSHNYNISIYETSVAWKIKDPKKPRLLYAAKVEDNKLNLYSRYLTSPDANVRVVQIAPAKQPDNNADVNNA